MVKVITGGLDKLTDEAPPEIQQQSNISAVLNGHHSAGIIVMKEALQLAIAKAKSNGCAVIGTNHTATGSGAIGYITLKLNCLHMQHKASSCGLSLGMLLTFLAHLLSCTPITTLQSTSSSICDRCAHTICDFDMYASASVHRVLETSKHHCHLRCHAGIGRSS